MEVRISNRRGFIQLPFLVIAAVALIVGSGVGAVALYKGGLPSFVANVSEFAEGVKPQMQELDPTPPQSPDTKPQPLQIQVPSIPPSLIPQKENPAVTIEKCKAEAQLQVDQFKRKLSEMYLQGLQALKNWERAILDSQIAYSNCVLEPVPDNLIGAHPDLQNQYRESKCGYHLDRKARLEKELEQERKKLDTLFQTIESAADQEYSRLYLACLNR